MKDDVNAGNLNYSQGKVEFENVFFSYIQGWAASVVFISAVFILLLLVESFVSQISNILNGIFLQKWHSKGRLFYRSPWTNSCTCKYSISILCCSRNISYYLCSKQLCCLIFLCKSWYTTIQELVLIVLFNKEAFNWIKVTVKTFIILLKM